MNVGRVLCMCAYITNDKDLLNGKGRREEQETCIVVSVIVLVLVDGNSVRIMNDMNRSLDSFIL